MAGFELCFFSRMHCNDDWLWPSIRSPLSRMRRSLLVLGLAAALLAFLQLQKLKCEENIDERSAHHGQKLKCEENIDERSAHERQCEMDGNASRVPAVGASAHLQDLESTVQAQARTIADLHRTIAELQSAHLDLDELFPNDEARECHIISKWDRKYAKRALVLMYEPIWYEGHLLEYDKPICDEQCIFSKNQSLLADTQR